MKRRSIGCVLILVLMFVLTLSACSDKTPAASDGSESVIDSVTEATGTNETQPNVSDTDTDSTPSESDPPSETESESIPESETTIESETTTESETLPAEDSITFRFSVLSDTHIGDPKLQNNMSIALGYAKDMSNNSLDAVLFAGDLTEHTGRTTLTDSQIKSFRSIYLRAMNDIPMVYCLGPTHDLPVGDADEVPARELFYTTFGEKYFTNDIEAENYVSRGVRHVVLEGYHIFAIDYKASDEGCTWLKAELDKASAEDADKPIFAILHDPTTTAITSILNEYPQVIVFTGHFHNSLAREDSINQDGGCTQVHCGGTAYYRVDGYNRYSTDPFLNLGDTYQFAQNLYVEVDKDHNVTITRVDAFNKAIIGEAWVVGPGRRDVYTSARKNEALPSTFSDDATLRVEEMRMNGSHAVNVSFDAATMGSAGSPIYYTVELYGTVADGKYRVLKQADLGSQQVFYPNDNGIPRGLYTYTFLDVDVQDYAIVVKAVDCWKTSGNVLCFTTGGYVHNGLVGGKVEHSKSDENLDVKQVVEFTYDTAGESVLKFSESLSSLAIRFHPTEKFSHVIVRPSSFSDEIGTLIFALYRWNDNYEQTIAEDAVDTFTLTDFAGSTPVTIFDEVYDAGEYLIVVSTPNATEGVGLYAYPLKLVASNAYICYENDEPSGKHLYFGWSNELFVDPPFNPIDLGVSREPYMISFENAVESISEYKMSGVQNCTISNLDKDYITFTNTGGDANVRLNQGIISSAAQDYDVVVIKYRSRGAKTGELYAHITTADGATQYKYQVAGYEYIDDGEWHYVIVNAEAAWGDKYPDHNLNFVRLDMSNENGSEVDIAYLMFFANLPEAQNYVNNQSVS